MSFLFACCRRCLRATHVSTLRTSIRRTESSTAAAVRRRGHPAAAARSTGAVAEPRRQPLAHPFWGVTTPALVLASPAMSLVSVWPPSAAAAAAARATLTCRARALSAAAPRRVLSCGVSRGLATVAYPAAASRGMPAAAANFWAAARTPSNGGGAAWRPLCGGGRGAAATAEDMVVGARWATTGAGGGRHCGGGRSGSGGKRGSPSSPGVTRLPSVASADEQAVRSRWTAVKARRVTMRASSGLAEVGGGDQSTPLSSAPIFSRPVVVPTPDVAVRVSDDTVAEVESLLGHRFASRATLLEAMTHASVDEETRAAAGLGARNNERLEWLGDGALHLVCAHFLHSRLPDHPEGELSRFLNAIISRAACSSYVADLGLGGYLHIGQAAANTVGQGASSSAGNFFEALLGALFVDGGWGAVDAFFTSRLQPLVVARLRALPQNFRSILTNYAVAHKLHLVFALAPGAASAGDGGGGNGGDGGDNSSGGSGAKVRHLTDGAAFDSVAAADGAGFRRVALLDGEQVGTGWGRTRKAADMAAAEVAFHELRRRGWPIEAQAVVDLGLDGTTDGEG